MRLTPTKELEQVLCYRKMGLRSVYYVAYGVDQVGVHFFLKASFNIKI